jgi:hypothetical protein
VLPGWARLGVFLSGRGRPRPLEVDGAGSFALLVKRYSGDMPARAVLDELERVGAVERTPEGLLQPVTHGYVPQHSAIDKLGILGRDVADLIETIDHNLQHGAEDPRFQRKVMYAAIPMEALPAFRKLSGAQGQALLEKLDRWLAEHDVAPIAKESEARARVGLGIYYFEERLEPTVEEGATPP